MNGKKRRNVEAAIRIDGYSGATIRVDIVVAHGLTRDNESNADNGSSCLPCHSKPLR